MTDVTLMVLYPQPTDPVQFDIDCSDHVGLLHEKMGIPAGGAPRCRSARRWRSMSEPLEARGISRYNFRFGGEALLIVASVFVAILLESMWQDRAEAIDARESLAQVRLSLLEDRRFFDRVEEEQRRSAELTRKLVQWFESPETLPHQ